MCLRALMLHSLIARAAVMPIVRAGPGLCRASHATRVFESLSPSIPAWAYTPFNARPSTPSPDPANTTCTTPQGAGPSRCVSSARKIGRPIGCANPRGDGPRRARDRLRGISHHPRVLARVDARRHPVCRHGSCHDLATLAPPHRRPLAHSTPDRPKRGHPSRVDLARRGVVLAARCRRWPVIRPRLHPLHRSARRSRPRHGRGRGAR